MRKQISIEQLRIEGKSYSAIAEILDMSINTVKSYCRRNDLGGRAGSNKKLAALGKGCKQCGGVLIQTPGAKPRKFCKPLCRSTWWAAHPHEIQQKAVYHFTCPNCASAFTAYGNKGRKYCSHACYIDHRFGRRDDE